MGSRDCRAALEQLWDYLDHELNEDRMGAIEAHLRHCANCLPHAEFGEHFLRAIRTTRNETAMPASLRVRVMELIERERAGAARTGPPGNPS